MLPCGEKVVHEGVFGARCSCPATSVQPDSQTAVRAANSTAALAAHSGSVNPKIGEKIVYCTPIAKGMQLRRDSGIRLAATLRDAALTVQAGRGALGTRCAASLGGMRHVLSMFAWKFGQCSKNPAAMGTLRSSALRLSGGYASESGFDAAAVGLRWSARVRL